MKHFKHKYKIQRTNTQVRPLYDSETDLTDCVKRFFSYEFNFKVKFVISRWHFTEKTMNQVRLQSLSQLFINFDKLLLIGPQMQIYFNIQIVKQGLDTFILVYLLNVHSWVKEVWTSHLVLFGEAALFPLNHHFPLSVSTLLSWMASLSMILSLCLISASAGELNQKTDYF